MCNVSKEWIMEYRTLDEIFPNKNNPRKISKPAIKKLQKQILEVGFHSPIKLDNDGVILGGNSRYKALSELNIPNLKIPCMVPNWQLSDRERDEILITDNVNDGEWNLDDLILDFDLQDLEEWGLHGLNVSFEDGEEEEEPVKKREKKMLCCPNCGHVNVKKAFEKASSSEY